MADHLKIGVFGVWRGIAFIKAIREIEGAKVTVLCDRNSDKLENAKKYCDADVYACSDFDELLEQDVDAIVVCNAFNEHAPYAIRALRKGIHVFSETLPACTLKECVELVEAVEESGCIYSFAENYPYFRACMEMTRVYQSGLLGDVVFAEGEYVHPMSPKEALYYAPTEGHWRRHLPKTYYMTHAMAPLMTATGLMPRRVIGKVAADQGYAATRNESTHDGAGIMLVEMSNGSIFRIAGSCHFGTYANWYRLGCNKGDVSNVRGTTDQVRLAINKWDLPEGNQPHATESRYTPVRTEMDKKAASHGHGGGDYWVTWQFIQDLLNHDEPFMNVYRATAIAATGILGWRSVLDDSRQMDIPDFSKKEDRDRVRDDDLSPFPYADGRKPTLPCVYYTASRKEQ